MKAQAVSGPVSERITVLPLVKKSLKMGVSFFLFRDTERSNLQFTLAHTEMRGTLPNRDTDGNKSLTDSLTLVCSTQNGAHVLAGFGFKAFPVK